MSLANTQNSEGRVEEVGLIAGSGQFPLLFAHAARKASVRVLAVGFDGETKSAFLGMSMNSTCLNSASSTA